MSSQYQSGVSNADKMLQAPENKIWLANGETSVRKTTINKEKYEPPEEVQWIKRVTYSDDNK